VLEPVTFLHQLIFGWIGALTPVGIFVQSMNYKQTFHAAARAIAAIVCASILSGCSTGVLAPQGPTGAAQKSILIGSVVIMLAIVVPITTLAFVVVSSLERQSALSA